MDEEHRTANAGQGPVSRHGRLLDRVAERPDPAEWAPDELISLAEGAALFFPRGPLSEKSLRKAVVDGKLQTVTISRKIYTTPAEMRRMMRPGPPPAPPLPPQPPPDRFGGPASVRAGAARGKLAAAFEPRRGS
jgi:hypothetical protein